MLIIKTLIAALLFTTTVFAQTEYSGKMGGKPVSVTYSIEAKNGYMVASRDGTKSTVGPNIILDVSGKIKHLNKVVLISDIILPDDRNLETAWLVSYDLYFGTSDLEKLKSKLKRPLRLGKPTAKLKPGVPVCLFRMKNGMLEFYP